MGRRPSNPSMFTVVYTTPGGVSQIPCAEGKTLARTTLGLVTAPDGLLAEMRGEHPKVTWESKDTLLEAYKELKQVHDAAAESILQDGVDPYERLIGEADRVALMEYLRGSEFYG